MGHLDLSFHFGICCQWGRSLEGFSGFLCGLSFMHIYLIYVYGMNVLYI